MNRSTSRVLHFDSVGGASGDMVLAALLDLGVDPNRLNACWRSLDIGSVTIEVQAHAEHGLRGRRVSVIIPQSTSAPPQRTLATIRALIERAGLPERVTRLSLAVFQRLAEAEARVHGTTPDRVHFHEVGAADAIADIVGACWALDALGVGAVSVGPLPFGTGTITMAHGVLPNPPPAVVELLKGFAVTATAEPFELVTPTGAALLATWRSLPEPPPASVLRDVGHGFGHQKLGGRPNLLRALLLETFPPTPETAEDCLVLETQLDDVNPEWVGALIPKLLAAGAYDAFTSSIQMKKQRPGILVTVLCPPSRRDAMLDLLFTETTTFGVRETVTRRTILQRDTVQVRTPYGPVRVQVGTWHGRRITRAPEHEDCARAAEACGVAVRAVYEAALAAVFSAENRSDV